jgi:hypothetical protein
MSKALFRHLRGELNGFYITSLNQVLNTFTESTKAFLLDFYAQQFESGQMTQETIYNIGRFASVFLPRKKSSESRSALYLTESEVVDGEEFSERGLYNTTGEYFEFEHTDPSITSPDINTLATETRRSSLVGDEATEGYIVEGTPDVLDDNGSVRSDKVLANPPSSGAAYSDFHGNEFLFLSEGSEVYEKLNPALYIELVKAMQWIRYNGSSILTLCQIVNIVCPCGLVKLGTITVSENGTGVLIQYTYDPMVLLDNKEQRLSLFKYLVELKFKQVMLTEI